MPIIVTCDCGKQFRAKDEHAGRKGRCPDCRQIVVIPGVAEYTISPAPTPIPASTTRTLPATLVTPPPLVTPSIPDALCPRIYTDYGMPYSQLTRFAARQQGLRYFNGRWVGLNDYAVLKKEYTVIVWIRNLFQLSAFGTGLVVIMGLVALQGSAMLPINVVGNVVATFLTALIISSGITTLWYFAMQWNQVCRWLLVGLQGLFILIQLIVACIEANTSSVPGLVLLPTLIGLVIQGLIVWLLVCPTASRIYLYNDTH